MILIIAGKIFYFPRDYDTHSTIKKKIGKQYTIYQKHISALPQAPTNVRVQDVQPTSVRLSWSYDGDVVRYRVFFLTGAPPKSSKYKKVTLG